MQSRSINRSWAKGVALCGLGLAAGLFTFRAQGDQWDKKTILTVDQPIQIMDTYLDPGTYVLKLANSSNDRHIVYIFNERQNHLINTVMAIPNYQLQQTGRSEFIFWETPPGTARAMRAWFYPGDNYGQEFPYPKNLRQLASYTPPPAPAPAPLAAAPAPVAPAPEPQVTVAQKEETPAPEPQAPVEIAQNTPPPPPPPAEAAAPAPEPAPAQPPTELPKTATPYPLFGLGGLLSFSMYALLRMKRVA
jgi:hypothetical protein